MRQIPQREGVQRWQESNAAILFKRDDGVRLLWQASWPTMNNSPIITPDGTVMIIASGAGAASETMIRHPYKIKRDPRITIGIMIWRRAKLRRSRWVNKGGSDSRDRKLSDAKAITLFPRGPVTGRAEVIS